MRWLLIVTMSGNVRRCEENAFPSVWTLLISMKKQFVYLKFILAEYKFFYRLEYIFLNHFILYLVYIYTN